MGKNPWQTDQLDTWPMSVMKLFPRPGIFGDSVSYRTKIFNRFWCAISALRRILRFTTDFWRLALKTIQIQNTIKFVNLPTFCEFYRFLRNCWAFSISKIHELSCLSVFLTHCATNLWKFFHRDDAPYCLQCNVPLECLLLILDCCFSSVFFLDEILWLKRIDDT